MIPTLHVGDIIIVQGGLNISEINALPAPEGDIIMFREPGDPNDFIVHRAIGKTERGDLWYFTTKGDNNNYPDHWLLPETHILGKIVGRIPLFGFLFLFLQTLGGILLVTIVLSSMFLVSVLPQKGEPKNNHKQFVLWALISITFLSFIASFLTSNENLLYIVDAIALSLWYISSIIIPLSIGEFSSAIFYWLYLLVLVGIPISSDLIYRITGITPLMWWYETKHLMPIIWFLQDKLTSHYFSFISILFLLLAVGGIFFFAMFWLKRSRIFSKL
jgi:signal peptidase I